MSCLCVWKQPHTTYSSSEKLWCFCCSLLKVYLYSIMSVCPSVHFFKRNFTRVAFDVVISYYTCIIGMQTYIYFIESIHIILYGINPPRKGYR